ncbi:MAG: Lar family restriction alleviation protein [Clostridia bacterium]|nr:Lar family restriction alleviation protein [Clostridia bacterium]
MSESIDLKRCPCCDGEAEMKHTSVYILKARAVVCKECGLRTKLIFINTPCMNSKGKPDESTRYTEEQAEKIATELWNRRHAPAESDCEKTGSYSNEVSGDG